MVDISRLDEWDLQWRHRVESLNSAPQLQMFEVGSRGTLVGGDVVLSKSPDDELQAMDMYMTAVKPGVWTITFQDPREEDDFERILLHWISPGPLNFDNLPTDVVPPNLTPITKWAHVGGYNVDSGVGGVFDLDSLESLIQSHEDQDKEYIFETMADFLLEDNFTAVQVGLVVGGGDGGYTLKAREYQGEKVEIMIQRSWGEGNDGRTGHDEL
ncbi:hypothetical protein QCA50_000905 [Cerrena zonata]|uniref:Uncharacterized protein n=1 Tax=Cerrena zonata TaxID=2478898 RepID=A0AAW0GZR7_9APHY